MRHHNTNRKFGRKRDRRKALLRSLAVALVDKGKITTTQAKAKELRPYIEKLITRAGNKEDIASRRMIAARLGSVSATKKLMAEIAPKYTKRAGGYTRIVKIAARAGDASKMAVIEFV